MGTPDVGSLKSALAFNDAWSGYCTIAVFVGLVFEYAILFWSERERLTPKKVVLSVIAGLLIAGGVGGEYFFGSKASEVTRTLEGISEQRIADSNREAKQANAEAKEFEDDAAKLKAENLRLESAIAPRGLSEGQQRELAGLRAFSGAAVEVKSYLADAEAGRLATEIMDALNKAGLQVVDNRMTLLPLTTTMFGASVGGSDTELVDRLRQILSEKDNDLLTQRFVSRTGLPAGTVLSFGVVTAPPSTRAYVVIGPKPVK
jgi:hypothetical protein